MKLACPSRKLGPKFVGPFPVKRRINDVAYELELPDSFKDHSYFHVTLLKPAIPDPFPERSTGPPEGVMISGEKEFEVERILDCRKRYGQIQYLIKWKGYGPEDNSWEPESNIHAKELMQSFKRSHAVKLAQLGIRKLPLRGGNVRKCSVEKSLLAELVHVCVHRGAHDSWRQAAYLNRICR